MTELFGLIVVVLRMSRGLQWVVKPVPSVMFYWFINDLEAASHVNYYSHQGTCTTRGIDLDLLSVVIAPRKNLGFRK